AAGHFGSGAWTARSVHALDIPQHRRTGDGNDPLDPVGAVRHRLRPLAEDDVGNHVPGSLLDLACHGLALLDSPGEREFAAELLQLLIARPADVGVVAI